MLGSCYTDKEEYLSVQPGVHLLGNFAAQGMIFFADNKGPKGEKIK